MSITISESTLSEARRKAAEAGFSDVSRYVEYLIVNDEGPPDLDDGAPEDFVTDEVRAKLAEANEDLKAGRMKPVDEVFEEMFKKHNLPRESVK